MTRKLFSAAAVAAAMTVSTVGFAAPKVDASIPDYTVSVGVSGNLSSVGSDTLANLMTLWAEEFKR
ncbi:MAG: phosphate-binding protein, partial [Gammaproteobacteria bacterium]